MRWQLVDSAGRRRSRRLRRKLSLLAVDEQRLGLGLPLRELTGAVSPLGKANRMAKRRKAKKTKVKKTRAKKTKVKRRRMAKKNKPQRQSSAPEPTVTSVPPGLWPYRH